MALTVSQVARLAGISVRTLHHYDEIGLLRPSGRSDAGYRLYEARDLERLQQVLFFRELEFPLEEIARILGDPAFDVRAALRSQRELLIRKATHLGAVITAVDAAIARFERGDSMERNDDLFSAWRDFRQEDYEQEVKERWGDSEAYRESKARTARYTQKDWQALKQEGGEIFLRLAALLRAGTPPTASEAMEVAEAHRQHIERWFYRCSRAFHGSLGDLYVQDARFAANIDRIAPGLAAYARDAWKANAGRGETPATPE